MKKFRLAVSYFIMLTAPIVMFGEFALIMSGMGGAFDGTQIGTALRWSAPCAAIYWIVAARLFVHFMFRLSKEKETNEKAAITLACVGALNLLVFCYFLSLFH